MQCNADRFIEALIAVEMIEMQQQAKKAKQQQQAPIVVTLSRDFGSLGKIVAKQLAERLGLRCCDRYILKEVARRAHVDRELVKILDEHASDIKGRWWKRLLKKKGFSHKEYQQNLVKTAFAVSRMGGVIIGRGANLILGDKRAFRVRIIGSVEKCAERVAARDNIDFKAATKLVKKVNKDRAKYIAKLFNTDINDPASYDIVLNSDRYNEQQMVELFIDALEKAGYKLPTDEQKQQQDVFNNEADC